MRTRSYVWLVLAGVCLLGILGWAKFHFRERPRPERVPRLAPRGTFYFTEYASLRTPQGVIGFEPGQEVRFVSATERTLTVTDGKYRIEVGPRLLTNDLDIAALVRMRDEASQRQLASFQAAEWSAYQSSLRAFNEGHSARVDAFNRQRQANGAVGGGHGALDEAATQTRSSSGGPSYYFPYYGSPYYGSPYYYLRSSSPYNNPNGYSGYNVNDWNR